MNHTLLSNADLLASIQTSGDVLLTVPENGSSVLLLGLGVLSVAIFARFVRRKNRERTPEVRPPARGSIRAAQSSRSK